MTGSWWLDVLLGSAGGIALMWLLLTAASAGLRPRNRSCAVSPDWPQWTRQLSLQPAGVIDRHRPGAIGNPAAAMVMTIAVSRGAV